MHSLLHVVSHAVCTGSNEGNQGGWTWRDAINRSTAFKNLQIKQLPALLRENSLCWDLCGKLVRDAKVHVWGLGTKGKEFSGAMLASVSVTGATEELLSFSIAQIYQERQRGGNRRPCGAVLVLIATGMAATAQTIIFQIATDDTLALVKADNSAT